MKSTNRFTRKAIFLLLGIGITSIIGLVFFSAISIVPALLPVLIASAALISCISILSTVSFLAYKRRQDKETSELVHKEVNTGRVANFTFDQRKQFFQNAIQQFNKEDINLIVKNKALFKEAMGDKNGLLYYAAEVGGDKVVKYIKNLGVKIDEACGAKHPPIYYASLLNRDVLQSLINNKANVNQKLDFSRTPLMVAARSLKKECVELLLCNHANINQVSDFGDTALMEISRLPSNNFDKTEQFKIMSLLLESGADPTIRNQGGKTALEIAIDNNCDVLTVALLQKAKLNWRADHPDLQTNYRDKVLEQEQGKGASGRNI